MGFRDVNPETKSELMKSFENNLTPRVAQRQLHAALRDSTNNQTEYELLYADRTRRPRKSDIKTLYQKFLQVWTSKWLRVNFES